MPDLMKTVIGQQNYLHPYIFCPLDQWKYVGESVNRAQRTITPGQSQKVP